MSIYIFGLDYNKLNTRQIEIYWKKITAIPLEIKYLTQLIHLDLHFNQIKKIPQEIIFLTQLTYLDLSNNQIKEIPLEIQYLINLTQLYLDCNYIKQFIDLFSEEQKIKKIQKENQFLTQLIWLAI